MSPNLKLGFPSKRSVQVCMRLYSPPMGTQGEKGREPRLVQAYKLPLYAFYRTNHEAPCIIGLNSSNAHMSIGQHATEQLQNELATMVLTAGSLQY